MLKISLMDQSDLEEAFKIEEQTNPSPWSKENFFSSFDVGHKSLVCKAGKEIVGFIIFSLVKKESHLLNIAVLKEWQKRGAGSLLMKSMIGQSKVMGAKKKYFLKLDLKTIMQLFFIKNLIFIQDAVRADYYTGKNPDDAVLMSLDI